MKIISPGHDYRIDNYHPHHENVKGSKSQSLYFVKRCGENFPFNFNESEGTNCQEVLRVLIDRSEFLQRQKPCAETESIISLLKTALMLFETRAARIHDIKLDLTDLNQCVRMNPCPACGHVTCDCFKEKTDYSFWEGVRSEHE